MNESDNRTAISVADMESDFSNAALPAHETPAFNTPVRIRVISYRKLKHDPDGVSVKAVLDGLVHAGVLPDDSSKQVKEITFESRKSKDERTIIEIMEAE